MLRLILSLESKAYMQSIEKSYDNQIPYKIYQKRRHRKQFVRLKQRSTDENEFLR